VRELTGVSCPTIRLCVAVDGNGEVAVSRHPQGPATGWSVSSAVSVKPDGEQPHTNAVSCTSRSLCLAVGEYDSCPGPPAHQCFSTRGYVLSSKNPSGGARGWKLTELPSTLAVTGISCPTQRLCVAVAQGAGAAAAVVLSSTRPTGGARAWKIAATKSPGSLSGVSCASTKLCVAIDAAGNVLSSTHPSGGPRAWKLTADLSHTMPFRVEVLSGIDCPSTSRCVIVDRNGTAYTSTHPTRGASQWHADAIDGVFPVNWTSLTAVSCPNAQLCLAVDEGEHAILGRTSHS
jgi:hypothetical protein